MEGNDQVIWWELVTAVRDEGDGLSLCERLSWGYDCTHCRVTFNCCCGDFSATSSILYDGSSTTGAFKHNHPRMLSLFAESKDILSSLVITDVVSFRFNCMETVPFNQTNRIALEIASPVQPNVEGKACSQGPPIIWVVAWGCMPKN
jgi:hypothetical protein